MLINYFGHSCFKIEEKINGNSVSLLTDPFDDSVGLKLPKIDADIVSVSHNHQDHSNTSAIKGNPFIIDCAGEYDVKGVIIEGVSSSHDEKDGKERGENIIFRFDIEGVSIVHLGDLGNVLNNKQIEKIGGVDILLIPVGGKYTLDYKKAIEVISQIEPRIVIPMHYKTESSKIDIDGIDKFIKEFGIVPRYEEKLKISKKDLPSEDTHLVIFNNIK
ncbi:MAG: MBL fold metallo-hydrolase [Patescibacteria group bacterium]